MENCIANSLANVIYFVIIDETCESDPNHQLAANQTKDMQTAYTLPPFSEVYINISITVPLCMYHTPAYTVAGANSLRVEGAGTNGNKTFRGTSAR